LGLLVVLFFGYGLGQDLGGEKALYFIYLELYPFGSLIWNEKYFFFPFHFFFFYPFVISSFIYPIFLYSLSP
jgi:hypothetical protein